MEERRTRAHTPAEQGRLLAEARRLYTEFRASLGRYRVLDPACGSGNFLALSLRALKDFDLAVLDDAAAMGLPRDEFLFGLEAVLGIEINGYAAELARLTVWITELQWQLRKGLGLTRRPILDKLDGIVRADALITQRGKDSDWPGTDVVVGDPPFLGGHEFARLWGCVCGSLFTASRRVPPAEADLVAYWFAKTWERDAATGGSRVRGLSGLIQCGPARGEQEVLDRIVRLATIYDAWADEPWVLEGVGRTRLPDLFRADRADAAVLPERAVRRT